MDLLSLPQPFGQGTILPSLSPIQRALIQPSELARALLVQKDFSSVTAAGFLPVFQNKLRDGLDSYANPR